MKVILYMASTVNGFIAKSTDDTSWISSEEWNSYSKATRKAGNLIVGHRTYDILTKQREFSEFKDVRVVVVATTPVELVAKNHFVASNPTEALKVVSDADEIIVAGGGELNASFLAGNLVDEIYLDIEPRFFGGGIGLAHGKDFDLKLELVGTKEISPNELQLHYRVVK